MDQDADSFYTLGPSFHRCSPTCTSRRRGAVVPVCQHLLSADSSATPDSAPTRSATSGQPAPPWASPQCGAPMIVIERLTAVQSGSVLRQKATSPDEETIQCRTSDASPSARYRCASNAAILLW